MRFDTRFEAWRFENRGGGLKGGLKGDLKGGLRGDLKGEARDFSRVNLGAQIVSTLAVGFPV